MTTTLTNKIVKIRKEQMCWGCAEKFPKGTRLRFITNVNEDGFVSSYWCHVCDVTFLEHRDDFDIEGVNLGEVKESNAWFDNSRHIPRTYD